MSLETKGKLVVKNEVEIISDKFRKKEFIIEKSETVGVSTFTDFIKFQLINDRVNLIDTIQIGDEVSVSFNLRGRKWEKDGKVSYFTNLEAWRLEKVENSEQPPVDNMAPPLTEEDDLPF